MLVNLAVSTDYSVGMTSELGTLSNLLDILVVFTDYSVGMTSGLKTEK